ncbi:hypothetical protein GRI38_03525 [Altererythrobacter aurantiacus]|uniref:NIPSNAP protein n=1 Tax=Parapontixanthobacter aurantiacus TaxID=1463599 RepID=A0A844ZD48_9SPHN|nr:hypothetical protein [Parapontixanthobacter aurantiacus]MXO85096.1 hypothetical protein [Parapontixanthobacter aurantiacus]
MKKLMFAAAVAFAATSMTPAAFAQDADPALAELDWYRVSMIKWKPGKGERAHEIIEMFEKVDTALGLDGVIDLHMATGDYDSIVAFPMRQGIAAMGWAENPESAKWEAEFARQVGGEDTAEAIWDEFNSLIDTQARHLAHIDRD